MAADHMKTQREEEECDDDAPIFRRRSLAIDETDTPTPAPPPHPPPDVKSEAPLLNGSRKRPAPAAVSDSRPKDSSDDDQPIGALRTGNQREQKKSEVDKSRKVVVKKSSGETARVPKRERKTEPPSSKKVKVEASSPASAASRKTKPVSKKFVLTEANFEPLNRWWETPPVENGVQWTYLEHHSISFTPPYVPHEIPFKYAGKEYQLPPAAEEVANFWCAAMGSDYASKKRFLENFWEAFLETLPKDHKIFSSGKPKMQLADFTKIKQKWDDEKQKKQEMTKEEKEEIRLKRQETEAPYQFALFNWIRERVGSYKAEPPSLFRGRGEHPKMGKLKRRIFPEEVTLNLAEDAPVPPVLGLDGHCWGDVMHQDCVCWLAYYKDTVNHLPKYVFLGAGSGVSGFRDFSKYEKARKLKDYIERIRKDYYERMEKGDATEKQLGTAVYLIDRLALRVGGEKDTDEEADTVGCCSLRVEHITFQEDDSSITLDFLGKDSIRFFNTVKIEPLPFKNLRDFAKQKEVAEDIFDLISTTTLNRYLKDLMPELTAKVFRTYNASITLQQELRKLDAKSTDVSNVEDIVRFYNDANREVAILCNHQRSVPKQHDASMEKLQQQMDQMEKDLKECEVFLKAIRAGKTPKIKQESTDKKPVVREGMKEQQVVSKIKTLTTRKRNHDLKMRVKDNNKTVSNTTSKQHYMDPRITVAFCKRTEMPIEKLFNPGLRKKFPWAMFAPSAFDW